MTNPILLDFPLRGYASVWFTPNTPGSKIPSHGTDMLGETYAIDFVGLEPGGRSFKFYRPGLAHYLLRGVRLEECYGWGRPVFAALAGTIIEARDGLAERDPVNVWRDASIMYQNARSFRSGRRLDYQSLAGNYIIAESDGVFAVYAHLQSGSVAVAPGEKIKAGQRLANVGHSGNSTAPHLHFQLMDNADPWKAAGLPLRFREYEVFEGGVWRRVENAVPRVEDRIRFTRDPD